ncbi:MAG: FlgD immunoglobulin-like domain containing protein [bacterium]
MPLKRFVLVGAILLSNISIAFCWEIEQGSRRNELVLEVRNSSKQPLPDVSVKVNESPRWVRFKTRQLRVAQVLGSEQIRTVKFLFDVSEEVAPETEGRVELLVEGGEKSWSKGVFLTVLPASLLPEVTAVHQTYPNPFRRRAIIRYQLSDAARVSLRIYNLVGRLVKTLVNEEKPAGRYEVEWCGDDEIDNILPDGTYFYRLEAGGFTCTRKMVLVR